MRVMKNTEHLEGYVYQHSLEIKKVQNEQSENFGKEFIAGNVEIATDEELLNVVPVHFTYVTEMTKNGSQNRTYITLKKLIDEDKSVVTVGKEEAFKVKVDTALALNEFYNNEDKLVSTKTNEGGFISITNTLSEEKARNQFIVDMLITGTRIVEANEDRGTEAYMEVKGAVFNFRNALLPVEFSLKDKKGQEFFESLGASTSEPVIKQVWGKINCSTQVQESTEETAFGEAAVRTYERRVREWLITGSSPAEIEFGDEAVMTVDELKKAMADREVMLADMKKRSDEYKASKAASTSTTATPSATVKTGGFNF